MNKEIFIPKSDSSATNIRVCPLGILFGYTEWI